MRRSFSFGRRARRPKGAARLNDKEEMSVELRETGLGQFSSPGKSSSIGAPSASPRFAAIMSEQQAIITQLKMLMRSGTSGEDLYQSVDFMDVVARLESAQAEQRALLSPQSGEHVSADEQRLLVKQSCTMIELLSELTSGGADDREE